MKMCAFKGEDFLLRPALRSVNGDIIRASGYCTARILIKNSGHPIEVALLSPCVNQVILSWEFYVIQLL